MNSNYLYDYATLLERVLSTGYKYNYSLDMIEKSISSSAFFQTIEKDRLGYAPIIADSVLVGAIFHYQKIDLNEVPIYNQCLWAAEAYLRIQADCKLTFEAIFIYLPIKKMYELFSVYHEMDFSQIVQEFNRLRQNKTILARLLEKNGCSVSEVAKILNISYNTLQSLKLGRRDIRKVNAETAISLAALFNVRPETIAEIQV